MAEFAQFLKVTRVRLFDPVGPMDTRTPRTDEGAFEMQAEDPFPATNHLS
jgi:hypothetical protein